MDHFEVRGPAYDQGSGTDLPFIEYPVHELANVEIQTASTGFRHRMEG